MLQPRVRATSPRITAQITLRVTTVGYLVPRSAVAGRVHSVFAHACNLDCQGALLTLCTARAGNAPLTLRLAPPAPADLRAWFDAGEPIGVHEDGLRTRRTTVDWRHAGVWRPERPRPYLPVESIAGHLQHADVRLERRRRTYSSIINGAGGAVAVELEKACAALDVERAEQHAARLIGWGEGLTPAGDDFLIGLLAGLEALAPGTTGRRGFHAGLAAALTARLHRTTRIAAHYLGLASGGHFSSPLVELRDALLAEPRLDRLDAALDRAFDVGATSGADAVSGLLAALHAWVPARTNLEAA